jgi:hypothetical protein
MTKTFTTAAMILLLASTSAAFAGDHRPGDAALGALSGAVVLGPVGALAGAVVGYAAGPSIARSWGFDRRGSARHRQQASRQSVRAARAEATSNRVEKNPRIATSRNETSSALPSARPSAPTASTTPPVQTLE